MGLLNRRKPVAHEPNFDDAPPLAHDLDRERNRRERQYDHGPVWRDDPPAETNEELIERSISEIAQYAGQRQQVAAIPALPTHPSYVEPRAGVPQVGALSAQALVQDFEKTAKAIEEMSHDLSASASQSLGELNALAASYQAMEDQIKAVNEHVRETAAMYREEAKLVFLRIEDTTLRMQEVRQMSEQMRERLIATKAGAEVTPLPAVNLNLNQEPVEGHQ